MKKPRVPPFLTRLSGQGLFEDLRPGDESGPACEKWAYFLFPFENQGDVIDPPGVLNVRFIAAPVEETGHDGARR